MTSFYENFPDHFDGHPDLLPHNLVAEESVLACILNDGECYEGVAQYIAADDFYRERNRVLFDVFRVLYEEGTPINTNMVIREIDVQGAMEAVGGLHYLHYLLHDVHSSQDVEYYANALAEVAIERKLADIQERMDGIDKSLAWVIFNSLALGFIAGLLTGYGLW